MECVLQVLPLLIINNLRKRNNRYSANLIKVWKTFGKFDVFMKLDNGKNQEY